MLPRAGIKDGAKGLWHFHWMWSSLSPYSVAGRLTCQNRNKARMVGLEGRTVAEDSK